MRIVLVIVLLAGCSGHAPADAVQEGPCVVQAADDSSCTVLDANKTADQVAHLHDYWRGQVAVRLLDEDQGLGSPIYSSCDAMPVARFLPGDDATVYQGTGKMDIATRFTPAPDHRAGQAELWIRRADQDHAEYVADLKDGETVSIDVPYNASDLPHQTLSAWEFWVYFQPDPVLANAQCLLVPRGSVGLTIDIHRTLSLVPFPGHPDHWAGVEELPVLEAHADYDLVGDDLGYCNSGDGASHPEGPCYMHWHGFGPQGSQIVPPGTDRVRLTLQADPDTGYEDVRVDLRFHGADTRVMESVSPVEEGDHSAVFEIPARGRTDGPYATQSQWAFQVGFETASGFYSGGWTMQGSAVKTLG